MRDTDHDNLIPEEPEVAPPRHATSGRRWGNAAVFLLLAVLALAGWLRLTGLNWDSDTHLHPDERFLTMVASALSSVDSPLDYFRTSTSTLNPYNFGFDLFVYGNFPMTVTRYAAEWATRLCEAGTAPVDWCGHVYSGYDGVQLVGRFLSGLVDLLSILFTFLIGRRLYGRWAGLIAATLLALAVMPIQQSHFFTMDNWATLFTTVALYAAVRAATLGDPTPRFRWRWWAAFGLALGLAAASRINMAPLALMINVSAIILLVLVRRASGRASMEEGQRPPNEAPAGTNAQNAHLASRISYLVILGIALAAFVSILTFRVAQPYAFMDAQMVRETALAETGVPPGALKVAVKSIIGLNPRFLANMAEIQRLQAPEALFPPAIQWVDRPAVLFPLSNMILWGMGLTAGLFAWFAVLWAIWRMTTDERRVTNETSSPAPATPEWMLHAIPVVWTLIYFLYMGTRWVKSVRYFLPLYPALFVLAGWAVVLLWRRASGAESGNSATSSWRRWAVGLLAALVLVPSLLWAVTYTRIYREPMTRVAASTWIYDNVPSGATLLYDTAGGATAELQLPLKGMLFEDQGVPLSLDFSLPEDGVIRAVRFNYLSDPDFDEAGAADDAETIRVRINEGEAVEHLLALDGTRRAIIVDLPPTPMPAGQPMRLTVEGGPGGPVRAGTSLMVNEHWDDILPVSMDGRNPYGSYYTEVTGGQRPVTAPDSPEKREEVLAWLDEADYILISSQRAMWNLPRMPLTYPLMIQYYESLFDGSLGFELVSQFHEDTRLGPLYVSDTSAQIGWGEPPAIGWPPPSELAAEEAFSVYDHPPVWIFRKTDAYNSESARALLEGVDLSNVVVQNPLEATQAKDGLMLSAYERALQRSGGAYSEVFDIDGLLSQRPWLAAVVWMLALVLLGWIAFPLAFVALGGLPDRGYALSRVLALLIISYVPWLTGSIKFLPFSRGMIALSLGLLALLSAVIFVRRRAEITTFLRERIGYVVLIELLGVALFLLMVGIRLGNPDVWDVIWGGEKPMDLSYFTAVMRSTVFPPYDPWHAGGYINYYYYGFVFVGALTKLLGVVPAVAYNLALPMLFSMTGLGVFSIAWNLVTSLETGFFRKESIPLLAARPVDQPVPAGSAQTGGWTARTLAAFRSRAAVAGFIAVALALLLGNLAQVTVIGNAWYQSGSESLDALPGVGRLARTLDGGLKLLGGKPAPVYPGDWFWLATRSVNYEPGEVQPITEFPYFTFLYGDLHAHMVSMPLQMLALGWAVAMVLAAEKRRAGRSNGAGAIEDTNSERSPFASPLSYLLSLIVGALAIGVLRPTNTWDWPTYLLLGSLAVVYYGVQRDGFTWRSLARAALVALGLVGLSSLLFLPFSHSYGSAYSSASLWPGSYTRVGNYLLIHGLFLLFIVTHLARELRDWTAAWTEAGLRRLEPLGWVIIMALVLFLAATILLLLRGYYVAPLALPLLATAGLLALRPNLPAARRVVLALMAAGLGLTLVVEIFVLDGDVGRMNTVFKFYLQVWLMLSVACGVAAVWAWPSICASRLRPAWTAVLGLLLFLALLYPLTATPAKWKVRMSHDAPNTLDGEAFLAYVDYGDTDFAGSGVTIRPAEDLGAIDWLRRNVEGTPVIMEAHGGNPYRSIAARIAMYTGLPNVIGWDWHQRQQRAVSPGTAVTNRIDDVNNFYNTLDPAVARNILAKYDVEYIVVGSLENAYYWPEGQAKFDQMIADGSLTEVFRDATARILRVTSGQ